MTMTTEQGANVPLKVIDNHDGTYRVEFEPTTVGMYNATVKFAGQITPASPYKVNVQPAAVDTSKVRVTDLPDSKYKRGSPLPSARHIRVMMIVWRLRGNIISTALCWIV